MIKVFFGHTTALGAAYYRCMIHAFEMKKQGIAVPTYIDYDPKRMGNIPNCWERQLLQQEGTQDQVVNQVNAMVRQSDITVYQHFTTPMGLALLRMQKDMYGKPILLDMDDYAFDIPESNGASQIYEPGNEKVKVTAAHIMLSDSLIVSTEYLKKMYSKYNKNIHVVRNSLDFDIWDNLKPTKARGNKIRIGHIGAAGHADDKMVLKNVVPEICKKYPNIEFVFVGDVVYPIAWVDYVKSGQVKIVPHWENLLKYPQYLKDLHFDIGLAPLRDYLFNRCKSNLRYLEYSAIGIPTVASNVQPFSETDVDGNILLCKEEEDWIELLSRLVEKESLRQYYGDKAYHDVRKRYNVKDVSREYVKILEKIKEEHKCQVTA